MMLSAHNIHVAEELVTEGEKLVKGPEAAPVGAAVARGVVEVEPEFGDQVPSGEPMADSAGNHAGAAREIAVVAELIGGLPFPEEVLRLPLPAGAERLDGQVARLAVKGDAGAFLLVETEVVQVVNLVPKPLIDRVEAEELLLGIGLVELAG